jgi:DNA mismatch repair protein MutS
VAAEPHRQGPTALDRSGDRLLRGAAGPIAGARGTGGWATHADGAGTADALSILYPGARPPPSADVATEPSCFRDLNLDQVVSAVVGGFEDYHLEPFFYLRLGDVDAVSYRQEVFADLERKEVLDGIVSFSRAMVEMRAHLDQAAKVRHGHQRARRILDAANVYGDAVRGLSARMADADIRSRGLRAVAAHLSRTVESPAFTAMSEQCREVHSRLSTLRYSLHLRGLHVSVRRYDGEPDYSADVQRTFERFRQGIVKDYRVALGDRSEMNHVEAQILDRVALLFPDDFAALHAFSERWSAFCDPVLAEFDREVQFYVAFLGWVTPLRASGLPWCSPEVSRRPAEILASTAFDAALANKLVHAGTPIVTNDVHLAGRERILVVTGPNQGGKSTFARMVGQLHHLAALGCPVPGARAHLCLCDEIFTHFEREEDLDVTGGKLEDDLVRIRDILLRASADSVVVINEIFTSTTLSDATFLGRKVIERLTELGSVCVYVTFVDELSSLGETTVSMVSTVDPDDPSRRTFKVVRRHADGRSYAIAIAEKYGLTYEQLAGRIPR